MDNLYQYLNYESKSEANLPPGFRFHPTDEELVSYYLLRKVFDTSFNTRAIAEIDLNKCEPWDLPGKAKMGEKEWFFYTLRDRKYPTGVRTNRATEAGYWKATGKDREIHSSKTCVLVGMKKTLVYYKGRAPRGEKSNWVMHEYRLEGKFAYNVLSRISKDEWVISRVFQRSATGMGCSSSGSKKRMTSTSTMDDDDDDPYPPPDNIGSPSSISLSTLLDSTPFTNTTTDDLDNPAYDIENASTKEHVPCFSTTPPSFINNNNNNNNASSMFDDLLLPPALPSSSTTTTFNNALLDPSRNVAYGDNNNSAGYPNSLKALQENVQLNSFLFPLSMTATLTNNNEVSDQQIWGGFGPFPSHVNYWPAGSDDNNQQNGAGSSSQFDDCMWS